MRLPTPRVAFGAMCGSPVWATSAMCLGSPAVRPRTTCRSASGRCRSSTTADERTSTTPSSGTRRPRGPAPSRAARTRSSQELSRGGPDHGDQVGRAATAEWSTVWRRLWASVFRHRSDQLPSKITYLSNAPGACRTTSRPTHAWPSQMARCDRPNRADVRSPHPDRPSNPVPRPVEAGGRHGHARQCGLGLSRPELRV